MEDLLEANIPVYKFLQRPGDVVWVNSGKIKSSGVDVGKVDWICSFLFRVHPLGTGYRMVQ